MLRLKVVGITDLIATIVVLPDCIDRRNLVIASEAKQSRAAGQRGRRTRDCFVAPPLAMTAQPGGRRIGLRPPSVSSATQRVGTLLAPDLFRQRVAALGTEQALRNDQVAPIGVVPGAASRRHWRWATGLLTPASGRNRQRGRRCRRPVCACGRNRRDVRRAPSRRCRCGPSDRGAGRGKRSACPG